MEKERLITVKGIGSVTAPVDFIEINLTLEETNKDYKKGYDDFAKRILDLQKIISNCGFSKDELKTSEVKVYPDTEEVRKGSKYIDVFKGYQFYTEMIIRFDFDSDKLGKVFSSIAQSKPSPQIKVEFTVKDKEAVKKSLLAASAKDAREKADILCQAMNVKLGKLLTINYNWDELHIYSPTRYSLRDEGMVCACERMITTGIDFTPDDIRVKDDASFVWELTE